MGEKSLKHAQLITFGFILSLFIAQPLIIGVSAQGQGSGPGPGSGHMTPPNRDEQGSIWINTDIITIMASDSFPSFHFWFANDENGSYAKFLAQYISIIEFEDANDDGAYQTSEILNFAPLAAYEWSVQTGSETDSEGAISEIWLKYTKGGSNIGGMMDGMGMPHNYPGQGAISEYEDVTLQIWAHIYLEDYDGSVSNSSGVSATYTVEGSSELKMDIEIGNFPFSSETASVALEVLLRENMDGNMYQHMFETREMTRNATANSNMNWSTPSGNETRFEQRNQTCTQKIDIVNTESGSLEGFFSWLDVATITWPGGIVETVDVSASYVVTGAGLSVYLSYPHFDGGSVLHDPSIGVYEESAPPAGVVEPDYILIFGIGIIAILAIGVAFLRKR